MMLINLTRADTSYLYLSVVPLEVNIQPFKPELENAVMKLVL